MPEDIQSRFTVLERPSGNPGSCLVCGSVDRPVVDFGVEVDFENTGYGRAYFCVTCIKQAASKFPDSEIEDSTQRRIDAAVADAKIELSNGIVNLITAFSPSLNVHSDDGVSVVAEQEPNQNDSSDPSDDSDANGQLPGSADEAGSDDSGEGPVSVPSHRVDGGFSFGFGTDRPE